MADIDDRWHRTGPDGKPERTDRYGIGARWLVRWRDPDGRQRKKSFRRKVDAEQYATTIEHGLLSGTYIAPDAGKIMVEEWATKWLDAQAHVKPTTLNRSAASSEPISCRRGGSFGFQTSRMRLCSRGWAN
ncbi:hypothetical protein [Saccharopolyspora spinosa]|uniref:hypothetical protein n=1 Tax=Saccharopolyspora spinosa TaxID=60894 RepID=UPI00374A266F